MHRRITKSEKALAAEIDSSVKNKWTFAWLEERVKTSIWLTKGKVKKEHTVELSVNESIYKINVPGQAYCEWCHDSLKYESKGKISLLNHLRSAKHLTTLKTKMTIPSLGSYGTSNQPEEQPIFSEPLTDTVVTDQAGPASSKEQPKKIVPLKDRVANQEAAVLAVLAEQSWAFSSAPVLINLAKSLSSDPEALNQLSMDRTTASYKLKYGLAESFHVRTVNILKKTKFSRNIDEATSTRTQRVLTILVNYMDPTTNRLSMEHLGSLRLIRVDTESVFQAIDNLFKTSNIPWSNCMSMLMDSCAVMRGSKNGLEVRVRKERTPHLLDIDGDVCHHLHNATKAFCKPFNYWAEGLFGDVYSEFHWSSANQDALKEICFLLGEKYTSPTQFVSHRWLSCYDVAQNTLLLMRMLTVYIFSYLDRDENKVYRDIYDSICEDVSIAGKKRLSEIQRSLTTRQRSDDGKKRQSRLVDKVFHHRTWTLSVLGIYSAVLPVLKQYVCLFQTSTCMVHKLFDEQEKVFRQFLGMFVRPECFFRLTPAELKNPKVLSFATDSDILADMNDMFVGSTAERAMREGKWSKKDPLRGKLLQILQSGFISCAVSLQNKLPIDNKLLQAMSVLDPACQHNHSVAKTAFLRLPELVTNVLLADDSGQVSKTELQRQRDDVQDAYNMEVTGFCNSLQLPPYQREGVMVPVDEWWGNIRKGGKFPLLSSMAAALLTCFHGPAVESSFSVMGGVIDCNSTRMAVETYSSIQTVKYALRTNKRSAVQNFTRKDPLHTPPNHQMCRMMRDAASKNKKRQQKEREELEQKRAALSLKHQELLSKAKAKALQADAEKKARLAHRRLMKAKLESLAQKRKAVTHKRSEPSAKKARHEFRGC